MSHNKASKMKHYAGWAVFSAAIGHALDGLDLMILSFALSGIMASFGIDNTTAGTLTLITLAGAFVGGLIFGTLPTCSAPRRGRNTPSSSSCCPLCRTPAISAS